eukprot:XP_025000877.1 uncharacterized protein LOC101748547 [Gallus gallus]
MGALPPSRSGWNRALSNLAWSVCRDGHPRPLWAAVPGPHHPPSEEFPLTVPLASTFLRSKPLPLVPSPSDHGKSVSTRTRNAGCAVDPQTFTRLSAVTPRHKRGAKGLREAMLAPCWCKHPADASTLLMQAPGPTLCAAHRSCCPLVWVPRPQPCEVVAVMSQWCQGAAIVTRGAGSRAKAAGLGPCSVRPGEAWREQRLSCFSPSMPNMSGRKKEAPKSGKPVCMLCRRARVDPDICGQTSADGGLCAHRFCLFFANGLLKWKRPTGGIFGFPPDAIQHTIQLADQKRCFVCRGKGAAISCAETGCERSFHLPCAEKGECVTQYFGQHRSFCCEHRPRQAAEAAPSHNTLCVICLEPVGDSTSYHTMVCPTCKQAWFHRGCIRKQAMHAATMLFVCPVCRGKARFRAKMAKLGIQIPVRRPSWWDDEAYQALRERHRRCDVSICYYRRGREEAEEQGLWQLLLCRSCAANGTHWYCSYWYSRGGTWECDTCAGEAIASRRNYDLGIPSTSSQMAPGPSPAAAPRKHPRQRGTGRTRSRSPLQGRASGSQSRPRRCRGTSRTTARGAQSSTRTSARPAPPSGASRFDFPQPAPRRPWEPVQAAGTGPGTKPLPGPTSQKTSPQPVPKAALKQPPCSIPT